MSELQTKVGGSLNKIQESLQQGKQKLQTVQEISLIEQEIASLRQSRQELILNLGVAYHKKLRLNEIQDLEFRSIIEKVEELDTNLYRHAKTLEEMKATSQNVYLCSGCEEEVKPFDKFCGSCGTPVIIEEPVIEESVTCLTCEEMISVNAKFCPCCGIAIPQLKGNNNVL